MTTTANESQRSPKAHRELVRLSDGTQVYTRPIAASDKEALRKALEKLSPHSRYRRFLSHKATFTDSEVESLTVVDGVDHFAICAVAERPGSSPEIVGTARYFRLGDSEETAEPAVVVVDAYQRKGLGTALFQRLLRTASDRGIRRFHCELLADNVPMKRLINNVVGEGEAKFTDWEAGCFIARIPVPGSSAPPKRTNETAVRPARVADHSVAPPLTQ